MSARAPRFEVVRSDAGWFARFRAANGRKVWQTEVYARRRDANRAVVALESEVAARAVRGALLTVRLVDERTGATS